MNCKKIASVFLCVTLLLSMLLPAGLVQAAQPVTVTFLFADGDTVRPFFDLTVADGTAEAYGLTPAETDHAGKPVNAVSALDVLLAAHAAAYGEAFTAQTASEYLTVSYGFASKAFGKDGTFGFTVNGATPHDDVLVTSEWGSYYTGYALDTTRIQNGDAVTLYTYSDTKSWSDIFPAFAQDTVNAEAGKTFTVSATGYSIMFYGSNEQSVIDANTFPLSGASLFWTQDFRSYTPAGTLDAQGSAVVTPETEGTWYLVLRGSVNGTPVIPGVCTVTVRAAEKDPAETARWFPVGLRPVFRLEGRVLTIGIRVRFRDLNKKAADESRTYALQLCFDGSQKPVQIICK